MSMIITRPAALLARIEGCDARILTEEKEVGAPDLMLASSEIKLPRDIRLHAEKTYADIDSFAEKHSCVMDGEFNWMIFQVQIVCLPRDSEEWQDFLELMS